MSKFVGLFLVGIFTLSLGALAEVGRHGDGLSVLDDPAENRPIETISQKRWRFNGCYSQPEICRSIIKDGRYCFPEYLGLDYECIFKQETRPYACYCWK